MKAATWARVRELFERALDAPAPDRERVLAAARGEPEVLAEVRRLLAEHAADSILDATPAIQVGALLDDVPAHLEPRARIGPYEVVRSIGEGGMGTVYEAIQDRPRRRVALKVMHAGPTTPAAARRFEYEAELLGRLRHPNIARVFEAGRHGEGSGARLYFAMELVVGARGLLQYARDERLDVRARLELFREVCRAVHHGHQQGVVHRDLKPSNILVDGDGRVVVIDFGIARFVGPDPEVRGPHGPRTRAGDLLGTLTYMSPEQLRDAPDRVDVRADVYALGVVFYELLAGRPPLELDDLPLARAVALACDEEPPRLGTLVPALRGDLEWIAAKALEKAPDDRYASASELEADVARHVAREPVLAGPRTRRYRLGRFLVRHRFAVAALVAVVGALAIGLLQALSERSRALAAERDASEQADVAREVSGFLERMLLSADPARARGDEVAVIDVVEAAALEADEAFADRPAVEAAVRLALGSTFHSLGRFEEARGQLERSVALYGELDDAAAGRLRAATSLARVENDDQRSEEAVRLLRGALAALPAEHDVEAPEVAAARVWLGDALRGVGELSEAEELLRAAVEGWRERPDRDDPLVLEALNSLVLLLSGSGRADEAGEVLREALDAARAELGPDHPLALDLLHNRSAHARAQGRHAEAEELAREALDASTRVLGRDHPDTVTSINHVAQLLQDRGRLDGARPLFEEVVERTAARWGDGHVRTLLAEVNLAALLKDQGEYEAAEEIYARACPVLERGLGRGHYRVLTALNFRALLLYERNRLEEAEQEWEALLVDSRAALGEVHELTLDVIGNLYSCKERRGAYDEAEALVAAGEAALAVSGREDHPKAPFFLSGRAELHSRAGRIEEAVAAQRRAVELWTRHLGERHPQTVAARSNLGAFLTRADEHDEAEAWLVPALADAMEVWGGDHWMPASIRSLLADALASNDRLVEAEFLYLESFEVFLARLGEDHERTRRVQRALVRVARGIGDEQLAAEYSALLPPRRDE